MTAHISPLAEPILILLQGQLSSLILSHAPPHSVIEEQYLLSRLGLKLHTDSGTSPDLMLFQRHFVLYHLLYRLQHSFLAQQQGYLRIDLARVQCLPLADSPELTSDVGRRDYYLNWQHYYAMTDQLLDEHLNAFWHSASQRQAVTDSVPLDTAITLLSLQPDFTLLQLKKAYRVKALQLHPDRGGDQQQFILLRQAYQQLLQQF